MFCVDLFLELKNSCILQISVQKLHNRVHCTTGIWILSEPTVIPWKPFLYCSHFTEILVLLECFSFFETLKAVLIFHHAPLCCLRIHSVRIVEYVQCFSVIHSRQSLFDLFNDVSRTVIFSSQTVTLRKIVNSYNPHIRQLLTNTIIFVFTAEAQHLKPVEFRTRSEPEKQNQCDIMWWEFHLDIQCETSSVLFTSFHHIILISV